MKDAITYCIMLLSFSFCFEAYGIDKYVIQTDFVETLTIHEAEKDIDYQIPAYIKLSGGFLIECASPKTTYIVNTSNKSVYFRLLHLESGSNSQIIKLVSGDKISFNRVLEYYAESYLWSSMENIYSSIISFFNETRYGVVTKGKAAFLQTDNATLVFYELDPIFLTKKQLKLSWESSLQPKQIIIESDNRKIGKVKNISSSEITFDQLSKSVKKKLLSGDYTLKILLTDQTIYQNRFRIIDKDDIQSLYQFNKTF